MNDSSVVILVFVVVGLFLYVRNILLLFKAGQAGESILRAIGIVIPILGMFLGLVPNRKA